MLDPSSADVIDNPAQNRFELALDGPAVAAAYYRRNESGHFVLTHTEVPKEYSGRGFAGTLAQGVFDIARRRGDRLVLQCPFMAAWFTKHPNYADVVAR